MCQTSPQGHWTPERGAGSVAAVNAEPRPSLTQRSFPGNFLSTPRVPLRPCSCEQNREQECPQETLEVPVPTGSATGHGEGRWAPWGAGVCRGWDGPQNEHHAHTPV